ncbi:hypothetical protein [Spirillospora sp. NPDC048819]|uniref:hypothetical protein n=1 Tax=Spirillospora sp. NPDC048819 TaxID=3155268 RepID=UPI0033DFDA3E
MTALIVLLLALGAVMFVLGCLNQRKLYWKLAAWQYRNPEANEPSDAALGLNRFGLITSGVLLLAGAGMVNAADNQPQGYSTSQVRAVASAAASKVDSGSGSGIGSSSGASSDVYEAVNDEGDGNVEIRSAGGGTYELTNRYGKNPVCLTVTVENDLNIGGNSDGDSPWSHSISTSVNEGPC